MVRKNFMFVSVVVLTASASAFGDWTYDSGTGHWYALTNPGTWAQAETDAVAAGGHLVTVNDAAEDQWLYDTFSPGAVDWVGWIGLYQDLNDPSCAPSCEPAGGWKWISGDPVGYTNWQGQEPNNQGAEDWAVLEVGFPPLQWNDIGPTSASYPVGGIRGIIEREVDPAVPTVSEWGIVVMTLLTLAAGTIILVRGRLGIVRK